MDLPYGVAAGGRATESSGAGAGASAAAGPVTACRCCDRCSGRYHGRCRGCSLGHGSTTLPERAVPQSHI
jgi:hypothetical protein